MEKCSAVVNDWMLTNGLALYPDKSEAVVFVTSQAVASSNIKSVVIAESTIVMSEKAKSLGIILDKRLSFDEQVKSIVRPSINTQVHCDISDSLYPAPEQNGCKLYNLETGLQQLAPSCHNKGKASHASTGAEHGRMRCYQNKTI